MLRGFLWLYSVYCQDLRENELLKVKKMSICSLLYQYLRPYLLHLLKDLDIKIYVLFQAH